MRTIILFVVLLLCVSTRAATIDYRALDPSQFRSNNFTVRIPVGVKLTNAVVAGTVYTDAIEATNSSQISITAGGDTLLLSSDAATYNGSSGFVGVGTSLTALNATALASGTVANARLDAELAALGNLANAAGYLNNNGAGALSWSTPGGGTAISAGDFFVASKLNTNASPNTLNEVLDPSETYLFFEGDSSVQGTATFPNILTNMNGWRGMAFVTNAAVAGQSITQIDADWTAKWVPLLPTAPTNAYMFLCMGGNGLDSMSLSNNIWYHSNYVKRAWLAGVRIACLTVPARSDKINDLDWEEIRFGFNNYMRWNTNIYAVIDVERLMPNFADTNFYAGDQLHPNAHGNQMIALTSDEGFRTRAHPPQITGVYQAGTNLYFRKTYDDIGKLIWKRDGTNSQTITFTASGTYTIPLGLQSAIIEVVGGGGGGSGATNSISTVCAGSSGGAGEYRRGTINVFTTNITFTIGAGGSGGTANGTDGTTGGTTSFGDYISCIGGTGGLGGTNRAGQVLGAVGGTGGSGGQFTSVGGNGSTSYGLSGTLARGGSGGLNFQGKGSVDIFISGNTGGTAGGNGVSYGAGGGAAVAIAATPSSAAGGNGAAGVIIIQEFY